VCVCWCVLWCRVSHVEKKISTLRYRAGSHGRHASLSLCLCRRPVPVPVPVPGRDRESRFCCLPGGGWRRSAARAAARRARRARRCAGRARWPPALARRPEARAPDLTVAQPSGDRHLDRLGVDAIWQIQPGVGSMAGLTDGLHLLLFAVCCPLRYCVRCSCFRRAALQRRGGASWACLGLGERART
jgi:hypothetical protein